MTPHYARNLVDKWKQTVGYFVTTESLILQEALLDCIDFVRSAGLVPKVVICDQGSNNRIMISNLGITVSRPIFERNGDTIIFVSKTGRFSSLMQSGTGRL